MQVIYKKLLMNSGIGTSIGIIVAVVGTVLGLGYVWLVGAIILSVGISGILATLFWAFLEYVFSKE
jgi:hypothetical protein